MIAAVEDALETGVGSRDRIRRIADPEPVSSADLDVVVSWIRAAEIEDRFLQWWAGEHAAVRRFAGDLAPSTGIRPTRSSASPS